jgi:hypothetical protein
MRSCFFHFVILGKNIYIYIINWLFNQIKEIHYIVVVHCSAGNTHDRGREVEREMCWVGGTWGGETEWVPARGVVDY